MEHIKHSIDLPNDVTPSIEGRIDCIEEPIPAVEQNNIDMNADNIVISKEDELQSENINASEVNVNITNIVKSAELLREQDGMDLNVDNDICNNDEPDRDNIGNINDSEINLNVACDVDNTEILSDNSHHTHNGMANHMKNLNPDGANESSVNVYKLISRFPPSNPLCSETSSPQSSPEELFDSEIDVSKNHTPYSTSRNDVTLPYFRLPNPGLDRFLRERSKNLQTPGMKGSEWGFSLSSFKSKDKGDIVFTIDSNAHSKLIETKTSWFLNHPASFSSGVICLDENDNVIKDNHEVPRSSICSEYADVTSSLADLDESKSPGQFKEKNALSSHEPGGDFLNQREERDSIGSGIEDKILSNFYDFGVDEVLGYEADISGEDGECGDSESIDELYVYDYSLPPEEHQDQIADLHVKHVVDDADDEIFNEILEQFLDDELQDQIADLHVKHVLDDADDEIFNKILEQFLDDCEEISDGDSVVSTESDTKAAINDTCFPINQGEKKRSRSSSSDLNDNTAPRVFKKLKS